MKKIAVLLVICFITAIFVSSCNEKACPAYSQNETVQAETNG